jgi:hypothetical protein
MGAERVLHAFSGSTFRPPNMEHDCVDIRILLQGSGYNSHIKACDVLVGTDMDINRLCSSVAMDALRPSAAISV